MSKISKLYPIVYFHKALFLLWMGVILSGCQKNYEEFKDFYQTGEFSLASSSLGVEEGLEYDSDDLLGNLYAGTSLRAEGNFSLSTQVFDQAEQDLLWKEDGIQNFSDLVDAGIGFFFSESLTSYHGAIYEGVLINTFKALNSFQLGDFDLARVEFNRAEERQKNAIQQLKDKVEALTKEAYDSRREEHRIAIDSTQTDIQEQNPDLQARIQSVQNLRQYQDLRNPFTDYCHGLFRFVTGDFNKASDFLRNAYVLGNEENPYVLQDFSLAEDASRAIEPQKIKRVWVIYEDGIGPGIDSFLLEYPFFFSGNFTLIRISLPEFRLGTAAWETLTIRTDNTEYQTELLLDVNRYVVTEFDVGYESIVNKAISSAVFKTILQLTGQGLNTQKQNPVTQLIGFFIQLFGLGSAALTEADTRAWDVLPNSINIAAFPMPENPNIQIVLNKNSSLPVILPDNDFVLIFVKAVSFSHTPLIHITGFDRDSAFRN